jgi:hypothetical protein
MLEETKYCARDELQGRHPGEQDEEEDQQHLDDLVGDDVLRALNGIDRSALDVTMVDAALTGALLLRDWHRSKSLTKEVWQKEPTGTHRVQLRCMNAAKAALWWYSTRLLICGIPESPPRVCVNLVGS